VATNGKTRRKGHTDAERNQILSAFNERQKRSLLFFIQLSFYTWVVLPVAGETHSEEA